ncbi:hypothetical protein ACN4EK_29535 [Pantanalinema rosaneae CENA516]|uniref:hypothetical protein n=1 Tax=Pantanalinema rosaneae TaxID=1620701 RepID=UPI003D6EDB69
MSSEHSNTVQAEYQAGKAAFERGDYRKSVQHLEKAVAFAGSNTSLGGEIQIWLVTAYEAAGKQPEAIALCKQITRHPDLKTRKQSRRLLYILEAPKLKTRPEWVTQIPDLSGLSDSELRDRKGSTAISTKSTEKSTFQLEPEDLSQVNTQDNRFIWFALLAALLIIGGLVWLM